MRSRTLFIRQTNGRTDERTEICIYWAPVGAKNTKVQTLSLKALRLSKLYAKTLFLLKIVVAMFSAFLRGRTKVDCQHSQSVNIRKYNELWISARIPGPENYVYWIPKSVLATLEALKKFFFNGVGVGWCCSHFLLVTYIWIWGTECCGVSLGLRVISEAEIEPRTRNWTILILMTINGI